MAGLLVELLNKKKIAVISGGGFAQFRKSFVNELESQTANLKFLSLFPTCGAAYYRYENGGWGCAYQELLSENEKQKITNAFNVVFAALDYRHPQALYGAPQIEDRESQISFSPLGQAAPVAMKESWHAKNEPLRARMRDELERCLPEFEVRCGGLTTIDITRKGIDKAYGIKKMEEYLGVSRKEMLFIGDKLEPGGNDYPVKVAAGVDCIAVNSPEMTKQVICSMLTTKL